MTRLYSGKSPVKGMTAGPGCDPSRYELVKQLSPPYHEVLKDSEACSVWTARERESGLPVVLKILRDGCWQDDSPYEGVVTRLWRIAGYQDAQTQRMPLLPSGHPGQQHCIRILDFFALPWPGGPEIPEEGDPAEHYAEGVAVLERAGPSLAAWQRAHANPFVSIPIVRKIIRQVLLALDYLHDGLPGYGIGHTGLSLDNILLTEPPYPLAALDSTSEPTSPFVKVAGFGFSRWIEDSGCEPYRSAGSRQVIAAEQVLLCDSYRSFGLTRALDIWAVGVIASLLILNNNLAWNDLEPRLVNAQYSDPLKHYSTTPEVVIALASINPEAGWPQWFEEATLYQNNVAGFPFSVPGVHPLPPLEERIEAQGRIQDPVEVKQLASFLKACWVLDPFHRPRAKQLLKHEWLKSVE